MKTNIKKKYKKLVKDGWYIKKSINETSYNTSKPVILYELCKDRNGYRQTLEYLAYDIVRLLIKTFTFKVRTDKYRTCWLNDNPLSCKPLPGQIIYFK